MLGALRPTVLVTQSHALVSTTQMPHLSDNFKRLFEGLTIFLVA